MGRRFVVREAETVGPDIVRLVVEAPRVAAHAHPGQFVIVRANDHGERIPLTAPIDWSDIVFKGLTLQGIYGRRMFET